MVWRPSVNIVTLYRFQFLALPIRKKREKILMSHTPHTCLIFFFLSSVNAYKTITYQKKTIQRTYCENICLTFRRLAIGGLKKEYAVGRCHKWAISNGIPSFVRNDPLLVNVITAAIIFVKTIFIAKFLQKKKKNEFKTTAFPQNIVEDLNLIYYSLLIATGKWNQKHQLTQSSKSKFHIQ